MTVSRLGGCPPARQLCVLLLSASHFVIYLFISLFQEELEPDVDGSPRGGADVPQRPKVCGHGRLGTITRRTVEVQVCWCAGTRLAGANAPDSPVQMHPTRPCKCTRVFSLHAASNRSSGRTIRQHWRFLHENHEDLVEHVGAAASCFQMKMLLAQTFTKVLTSLLSLVTDPF